jgi:hypothetical protein
MSIMQMLLAARGGVSAYLMDRSVRIRLSAAAYFSRTPATASGRNTWTVSGWYKRGQLGGTKTLFTAYDQIANLTYLRFENDTLDLLQFNTSPGSVTWRLQSNALFRDPSAWYHIVAVFDSTEATAANRIKLYVNGVQITSFATATYPALNANSTWNSNVTSYFGTYTGGTSLGFDGYMADVYSVSGQALDPTSFGETNALTGVWQPIAYTGTYGTNGFYLDFEDTSSVAALGTDDSGNGNTWTVNNISLTAGVTYDSMTDVPTLTSATAANYAVLNPLSLAGSGTGSLTNANLTLTSPGTNGTGAQTAGSIAVTSSKYYFEGTFSTLTSASGYLCFGVQNGSVVISGLSGSTRAGTNTWWISDDGNYRANGGSITASGLGAFSAGNVAMIAIDASTGKGWIGKNGTWVGDPAAGTGNTFSSLPALIAPFAQAIRNTTTSSVLNANFGQRPFAYTPPTGFKALNTFNLLDSSIVAGNAYMDSTLYTGNGGTQAITNSGAMQPDLVWLKSRNQAYQHGLFDSVRGSTKGLVSNSSAAEVTFNSLTSFNADGFSLSTDYNDPLGVGANYVAWQWKAGGTAVTNTDGTISAQVSANPTAGFSVMTYTGTGANATVGHGLGVAPSMVIFKRRNVASGWGVYHRSLGNTYVLTLEETSAQQGPSASYFNSTSPSSTVISLGTWSRLNTSTRTYVAYCFAEIDGYSKFGSYTGNGSTDGAFVYLGFRPAFVLTKRINSTSNWTILDFAREGYNVDNDPLYPNLSNAEGTTDLTDLLSNGFKLRSTDGGVNASGGVYIYAAFAENPFKNSLAR